MGILKIIGKVAGAVLPSLTKEKTRVESVDTLLSKKGNATPVEVCFAITYKALRLVAVCWVIYLISTGAISFADLLKILTVNI